MIKSAFLATLAAFLLSSICSLAGEKEFAHPGVAHNQANLDFVRKKISATEEPWHSTWKEVQKSRLASLDWKAQPYVHIKRGPYNDPDEGSTEFTDDGRAAYTHSLLWALTGEETRAKLAAEILDAWASTLQTVTEHDARLLIGMAGFPFIVAAELLTHTWDGWPQENQNQFKKMLRELWYPLIKDFYPTANGNWDAAMQQTMIAMGVYLDDRVMFDRAVTYTRAGQGNGAIDNYFKASGQCQESGRDQLHAQMGMEFLINTCETAWLQGVDLYGSHDNRLLKGFEYTAKYNLGEQVPYEPYKSFQGRYHYKKLSDKGRGRIRPMYEKAYNHYHHRKGLAAPYSKRAVEKTKTTATERQTRLRRRNGKKRSERVGSLPWSALMYVQPSK